MTTIEQERYIDNLREHGYTGIPLAISGSDIDPLFQQFREFSAIAWPVREPHESDAAYTARREEGEELAQAMHYVVAGREKDADYYMIHRRTGENNEHSRTAATENKDVLHIGPRTFGIAKQRLGNRMPSAMKMLIENCAELHEAVKTSVRPLYRALGIEEMMLAANPEDDIHMIRILRYLGTEATHRADLHFDRSTATLAAWESSPGLVGTPGNNAVGEAGMTPAEVDALANRADVSPINHTSGEGKFFLSAGYNRLPPAIHAVNGPLPLLAHGVVNEQSSEERDAIVVFMNPHVGVKDYVVPTKAETSMSHLRESLASQA